MRSFQRFTYNDEENLTQIFLLKNKQGNQILTADHSMMDFFLIIKNNFTVDTSNLLSQLRNTNGIVAAFKLESESFSFIEEMI